MEANIKKKRGSALVEFAIAIPVLILITFSIIEYSIIFYDKAVITNASREGARYGIVLRTPSYVTSGQVVTFTKNYLSNKLINFSAAAVSPVVTATPSKPTPVSGDTLTVTVSYTYTYLILSTLMGINPQVTLTSTTVMVYE